MQNFFGVFLHFYFGIDNELEGRCSESECVEWLYSVGLTAEDLEELGYGYLNDLMNDGEPT